MGKSIEEKRAENRERQARWRANNLVKARIKEKNAARIRRGTMEKMPGRNAAPNVAPNFAESAPNAITQYGELEYGEVEGVDVPYEGHGRVYREGGEVKQQEKRVQGKALVEIFETEEERRVNARLKELLERQVKGELDKGVDIPLDI
jgi:hypothetical protein